MNFNFGPIALMLFCRTRRDIIDDGFELNVAMNEIGYRYPDSRSRRLFWSLPSVFTGNKVRSYGGNLTLTQHITAYPDAQSYKDQDILLIGNGITLFWTNPVELQPEIPLVRRMFYNFREKSKNSISGTKYYSMVNKIFFDYNYFNQISLYIF